MRNFTFADARGVTTAFFIFLTAITSITAITASAQVPTGTEALSVTVLDRYNQAALDGALVELIQDGQILGAQTTGPDGTVRFEVIVTGTETIPGAVFSVSPPYPNPSTGTSTIPLELDETGDLRVDLFDAIGRKIIGYSGILPRGNHAIHVDLGGLSRGTYFARVRFQEQTIAAAQIVLTSAGGGSPAIRISSGIEIAATSRLGKGAFGPNDFDIRVTAAEYDVMSVTVAMPDQNDVVVELDLAPAPSLQTMVVDSTQLDLGFLADDRLVFFLAPGAPSVSVDDILVGQQGAEAFLRRVTSVEIDGDSLRLATEVASLNEAIRNGVLDARISLSGLGKNSASSSQLMAGGVSFCDDGLSLICLNEVELFSGTVEGPGGPSEVTVTIPVGGVTIDPEVVLEATFRHNELTESSTATLGNVAFNLELLVTGSGAFTKDLEVPIYTESYRAAQMVGSVPVYEMITVTLFVGFEIEMGGAAQIQTGFSGSFDMNTNAWNINGQWNHNLQIEADPVGHSFDWGAPAPATIKSYVRTEIDVQMFEDPGPVLSLEAYLRMISSANESDWAWNQVSGFDLNYEVDLQTFDKTLDPYIPLAEFPESQIAENSGQVSNPGCEAFETETNSIGMSIVCIPAGSFQMGSNEISTNEQPVHSVTLTKDFWIGQYEVTQAQYLAVTGLSPSGFTGNVRPVEQVSWLEAIAFANALSQAEGLTSCYHAQGDAVGDIYSCTGYRLPTEAEWEYATRAGTTTTYSFGNTEAQVSFYAWYKTNSGSQTHAVGGKLPNPWGLYDVHGNVWEWIHDLWDGSYYNNSPSSNPPGGLFGSRRVLRGGSWLLPHFALKSANRVRAFESHRDNIIGFRLARGTN